jgi:predicted O-linked N-acetylglucosamine transferase (SPINDLY family)
MRSLEIDIAVDLKGYTGDSRSGVFARRPAPIQINYIGYPGTMALEQIDYLLADPIVMPPELQQHCTEAVVCMPECYQVNDDKRVLDEHTPSRAEVGLPEGAFVFCCFNNNYKLSPRMFDVWMRILDRVPDSVLWLLEDNPVAARNLRREAQARGISPERLVFAPRMEATPHLSRHRLADLFLDTLPYNAHTTTSDALWAGLPVLTCLGVAFPGRVAASLLHAAGLPELVTHDLDEYSERAVELARDSAQLRGLRDRLAYNRTCCPLFDTARFCRHLEAAYTHMWKRYQAGLLPEGFTVPALPRTDQMQSIATPSVTQT